MPISPSVLRKYVSHTFFETGTHNADGVLTALEVGFDKVISIEINRYWYDRAIQRTEVAISQGRVQLYLGDSHMLMPHIVRGLENACTFWLDAHWDGDVMGVKKCPLLDELRYIKEVAHLRPTILIDDLRLFGTGNWGEGIHIEDVYAHLREINPDYNMQLEDGIVPDDILAAYF